jgi:hypothetical protein
MLLEIHRLLGPAEPTQRLGAHHPHIPSVEIARFFYRLKRFVLDLMDQSPCERLAFGAVAFFDFIYFSTLYFLLCSNMRPPPSK